LGETLLAAQPSLPHAVSSATLAHLEQLIDGLTTGAVLLDTTGAILWANAAARAMHGVETTEQLGATADEYCQRFCLRLRGGRRLQAREYPVMKLLAGESFDDMVVDVMPKGDSAPRWVHSVRDIIMDDGVGGPDCLALVIEDASLRFEAEDRFERMFNANPAPALITRLADQRHIRVNQGFLDMTGYSPDAVIGKSLFEFDVLAGAENLQVAKERLAAGDTIPQMEAELLLPDGGDKLVIVAGQPIEVSDEPCMLWTFADLEPRRRAERALRGSEDRFSRLFALAPVAIAVTSADGQRMVEANAAFAALTGYPAVQSIGRSPEELGLWGDEAERARIAKEIAERGGIRSCDVRIVRRNGDTVDCLMSAEAVTLRGERSVMWLYQDITARRHTELELIEAIEAVMKDTSWFSRSVMEKLANLRNPHRDDRSAQVSELTPREREVLELICEGLDDRQIGERLQVSANTVRNHVTRVYAKIGVNKRGAAMVWARERGVASLR
jgi:PAS domain S-box-containing protein